MNKSQILTWYKKYSEDENSANFTLEKELGAKLRKTKQLTKKELVEIVRWKFEGKMSFRKKRTLNLLANVKDSEIRKLSSSAFNEKDDKKRMELLTKIKGIGPAMASSILSFYDPQNYAVYDIHICRELFGKEPKNSKIEDYLKLLDRIRKIAEKNNLDVRTIEKALFKKNFDES